MVYGKCTGVGAFDGRVDGGRREMVAWHFDMRVRFSSATVQEKGRVCGENRWILY